MLDYDKVRQQINDILEVGDSVKASSKILELNDMVTQSQAEDTAEFERLNNDITNKDERIKELEKENVDIRQANADVMLKYGELLNHQPQQIIVKETKEEDNEPKEKSWEEIAKMD